MFGKEASLSLQKMLKRISTLDSFDKGELTWIRFLEIGTNRVGAFTWEKFYIQVEDQVNSTAWRCATRFVNICLNLTGEIVPVRKQRTPRTSTT